ncbi:hypothetical protein K458DRAFT_296434 [Lentithecium fluviatile CBS 122367]|uniref:Uncharacterized protein n=1 Tax=Lentithecium fluviatile CBS 122367 TaxID=1168545 RepID=A0A6G1JAQ6_9PLEO|nr:hypothetical protein K458DRAFT_296434 [Lentithecium fluviatile CBS 122367]
MKTDNYLTLCLEQAANSPLRYRHGCIIVRGGKVIGQGFNDHRAGFDGGALKTGRLPSRSIDGAALAELKKKHKLKRELKYPQQEETNTFTPFENMGGSGKLTNNPLSMHSEMMAIHSALATSGTIASSAVSYQKPYFKLSGDSKRKARLRRDAIKAYVETVCKTALAQFKGGDLNALHLNRAQLDLALQLKEKEKDVAEPPENSMEKHRTKNQKYHHQNNRNQYHGQHHNKQRRQYARKLSAQDTIMAPCHSNASIKLSNSEYSSDTSCSSDSLIKPRKSTTSNFSKKTQPFLVPQGHAGRRARSVADRTKNPRLNGADLYVARLGWRSTSSKDASHGRRATSENSQDAPPDNLQPLSGSLHDELLNPKLRTPSPSTTLSMSTDRLPTVLASRPCYRCISYMNSVGIKRVFWTTDTGEWECAKVRDLVEALDNLGEGGASNAATALSNVFVTKHEILMLRRTMADS